jgi:hypothetical protein
MLNYASVPAMTGFPDECIFRQIDAGTIILENDLAFAMHDGFPVTHLHALVIPKRHVTSRQVNRFLCC